MHRESCNINFHLSITTNLVPLSLRLFPIAFNSQIIAFNIITVISTLLKISQQYSAWIQQSMFYFWDQQSNNLFQQVTNITNNSNNYPNSSTFSQLESTKHALQQIQTCQQCTKLLNSSWKRLNNVVWSSNIISSRLLVIFVTIVQVYVRLTNWLCYTGRWKFPLYLVSWIPIHLVLLLRTIIWSKVSFFFATVVLCNVLINNIHPRKG